MSEPESIDSELAESMRRIEGYVEAAANNPAQPPDERSERLEALRRAEFPERHVRAIELGKIFGPSFNRAQEIWPKIKGGDALIVLTGDRGPGKTQMATLWSHWRVAAGRSAGRYIKCTDLLGEIKATWHDGGKRLGTEQDVLRRFKTVPYLVIDEFHEKGDSEWDARCLINIIDHRYDGMLATVLIANLAEDKVKDAINPSIISRANETGGLVNCDWESYRQK